MKMSEKKLLTITVTVAVLATLLLGGIAYYVHSQVLGPKRDELAKQNTVNDGLQKKRDEIPALDRKLEELRKTEDEIKKILPKKREATLESFTTAVEYYCKENNVTSKSVKTAASGTNKPDPKALFQKVSFDVSAEGTFWGLYQLVASLENHERFVRVDKISMKPAPAKQGAAAAGAPPAEKPQDMQISLSLTFSTFVFNEQLPK